MVRLAVCDDNAADMEEIVRLLQLYAQKTEYRTYTSEKELEDAFCQESTIPQIVLMDIELQGENGIKAAESLNRRFPSLQFIFVTAYNQRYAQQLFLHDVNLAGYVVKPIDSEILKHHLSRAIDKITASSTECFNIAGKASMISIPFSEIRFVESRGHYLSLHLTQNSQSLKSKMSDVEAQFPENFLRIHKSFLINMDHARELKADKIVMKDGRELPVSRSQSADVRRKYFIYRGLNL